MNTNQPVALITGASSGIGRSTALLLAQNGYTVYGVARRLDRLQDLEASGIRIRSMDLTVPESIESGLQSILSETGRIDVLINNAGYGSYGALEEVPIEEAVRQFEVNVFGLMRLTQAVLPGMRARKKGFIVNITSVGGKIYLPLGGWYHATKHALEVLSDVLRFETEPFGIKTIIIEPGAVRTEWGDIALGSGEKVSGVGPYAGMTRTMVDLFKTNYQPSRSIGPEVIAQTILKALQSRTPKTRYAVGPMVGLFLAMKRYLSDRGFEGLIRQFMKQSAK
ncbi:SDR family NAD(P)-dependent oxidoreductase [bacterium]|nr:SDR family NAD(P)-dependent oxidoreductase [bacterium]